MAANADVTNKTGLTRKVYLRFALFALPALAIVLLTLAGVAYASVTRTPMAGYWVFIALCSCAACLLSGWRRASRDEERWRLARTQVLHWGAFLVTMAVVFLPPIQAIANADITSLIILILLALGSFTAGVHAGSWSMCLAGLVMALCAPAIAWLDQSVLLILVAVAVVLVIALAVFMLRRHGAARAQF